MANYTQEDVQNALQQGLISEDDASYLINALGTQPSLAGGLASAAAGGLGGAILGSLAGKALGRGMDKMATTAAKGDVAEKLGPAADWMTKQMPDNLGVLSKSSQGAVAGAAGLGGLGAVGGGIGGAYGFGSPGEGVGGKGASERDVLLRALIDPNVPNGEKKKILTYLQNEQEAMAAAQENQKSNGMDWQSALGSILGLGVGGLAGGAALKAASKALGGMDNVVGRNAAKFAEDRPIWQQFQNANNSRTWNNADAVGAVLGGGLGAAGGAMAADALQSRFADPFAETGQM